MGSICTGNYKSSSNRNNNQREIGGLGSMVEKHFQQSYKRGWTTRVPVEGCSKASRRKPMVGCECRQMFGDFAAQRICNYCHCHGCYWEVGGLVVLILYLSEEG